MVSDSQSAKHKRIFLALWPDELTRQQLLEAQKKLKRETALQSARAVISENLHMTLHFIGSISMKTLQALETSLDSVQCKAFDLNVDSAGCFPKPKVFWLGLKCIPPELEALEQQTAFCIQQCVKDYQVRPYRPHITLFRKAKVLQELEGFTEINWQVKSFALVESKNHPEGVQYLVLKEWLLL